MSVRFSTAAQNDLSQIAEYTLENWGVAQSRKYRDDLIQTLDSLQRDPRIGRLAHLTSRPVRQFPFASHVIYYLAESEGILIVRVLAQAMDQDRFNLLTDQL
jgi:toxin ParE1/3/4